MRTLIVSDLHLGSISGSDLLRREEIRQVLFGQLEDVERLVLLGDVLELRHGPLREAMAEARPFFEDLGAALGDRQLVIAAGNHDHGLVEPWLEGRGGDPSPPPLALEQLIAPADASPAMAAIAGWVGRRAGAPVTVAYPGLWVRPDVYASHGHYLDCHLTVPTLERLSVAAMSRVLRRPASVFDRVEDYEAVGSPVFAWRDAVARYAHTGAALNGMATVSAWQALGGGAAGSRTASRRPGVSRRASAAQRVRRRAIALGFPLAVAALNRAGLGPLRAEISGEELRRAGLAAMGEVAARLGLGDAYVVFGHTHRSGPLPADDPVEWLGRGGARLVNCGSWTYAGIFLGTDAQASPYWPGACVVVGDEGPPEVRRLLQERSRDELRPARRG